MKTQIENIIAELETRIAADCKIVDREAAFNECLDAEGEVNVAGLTFMPSQIWREMDPTAHRCGVNDYADGQDWVEVRGETYQQDDAEAIKTDLTDDLDSQKTDLEGELDAEENPDEGETVNAEEVARMKAEIEAIESQLAELEKHSF